MLKTAFADSVSQVKGQQCGLGTPRGPREEVPGLVPASTGLSPLWKPPWPWPGAKIQTQRKVPPGRPCHQTPNEGSKAEAEGSCEGTPISNPSL